MAKIHSMMDIGKRSMMNSQAGLQTVAHNIANKSTEGYSRQRVDQVTAPPVVEGRLVFGMGARAAQVSRINNPFLEKQLQRETGVMGYLDGQAETLGRVEQVFNEQGNKGLNQYLTDFFNAFRELSNNPESVTSRNMVKETAEALTRDFQRVNSQLNSIQKEADLQIQGHIDEINKMTREVASLNEKIAAVELQGVPANDERDRRDLLIKEMTQKLDIKVAEGDNGMITVSTAGNAILVSGYESHDLTVQPNPDSKKADVLYRPNPSAPPFVITDRIRGGTVGGVLEVRDHIIEDFRDKVDELAFKLSDEVNQIHVNSIDRSGRKAGFFFEPMLGMRGAADNLRVSTSILDDVSRIGAAAQQGAPGDNTAANVISQLQYKGVMGDGTATFDDYYNSQVGRMGVLAQRAIKSLESQKNIVGQVNKIRESVSGVSLDEEATKMIEYQKTFDASARVIRTADEMFDTVLNLKRL